MSDQGKTWNPFEAQVASAPDGGWPDDEPPVEVNLEPPTSNVSPEGGWPDDDSDTHSFRERADSTINEPKTGHDFTSPAMHPFHDQDSKIPSSKMTKEAALARIAELEARNRLLVQQGQERLKLKNDKLAKARRTSEMLTVTEHHKIIQEELAAQPETHDVLEHWASESSGLPENFIQNVPEASPGLMPVDEDPIDDDFVTEVVSA